MSGSSMVPVVRLGIADLERRLGVDRSTIWRWYRSGKLPAPEYVMDARTWRLDVIEAWEQAQLSRPPEARRGASNLAGGHEPSSGTVASFGSNRRAS